MDISRISQKKEEVKEGRKEGREEDGPSIKTSGQIRLLTYQYIQIVQMEQEKLKITYGTIFHRKFEDTVDHEVTLFNIQVKDDLLQSGCVLHKTHSSSAFAKQQAKCQDSI